MTHKFGVRLPKTVKEALEIDQLVSTDFWKKAINKELAKVKIIWATHDGHHLALLIAALNDIDIMSCDLENAYLNAPCREKIWFEGGLECGEDRGKVCVVVRSLYGLKSAGAAFRSSLAQI